MLKNHYVKLAILAVVAYLAYRYFVDLRSDTVTVPTEQEEPRGPIPAQTDTRRFHNVRRL